MIAGGLQVLTYPAVGAVATYAIGHEFSGGRVAGADQHVLVVGVHSPRGSIGFGPTCVAVGRSSLLVLLTRTVDLAEAFILALEMILMIFSELCFAVLFTVADLVAHGEGELRGDGL